MSESRPLTDPSSELMDQKEASWCDRAQWCDTAGWHVGVGVGRTWRAANAGSRASAEASAESRRAAAPSS